MPGMKITGGLPCRTVAGGKYTCGRFGWNGAFWQPVNATADAITKRTAAEARTLLDAGPFVVGGTIMSNPVQDARRELKISPYFVGTVAHLRLTIAICKRGGSPTVFDARAIDSCDIVLLIKGDCLVK
jgi:hypothetical protein